MQFYEIKPVFSVNANYIKTIEKLNEDNYMLTMVDGEVYYIHGYKYELITGAYELKCITAVEGFVAHFKDEYKGEYTEPIYCFGVFENGDVKPLSLGKDTTDAMNEYGGFCGVSKDGEFLVEG